MSVPLSTAILTQDIPPLRDKFVRAWLPKADKNCLMAEQVPTLKGICPWSPSWQIHEGLAPKSGQKLLNGGASTHKYNFIYLIHIIFQRIYTIQYNLST